MQLFPIFQAKYALSVCPGSLLKKKSELPNSTKKKKDKSWFKGSPRTVYHVLTTGLLRARFSLYNEPFSAYFIQKSSLHPNFLLDFVAKIQLILHLVSRMLARQNGMARGHDHSFMQSFCMQSKVKQMTSNR